MENYPYPKSSLEFFSRQYSIDQLVKNYELSTLITYLSDGRIIYDQIKDVLNTKSYIKLGIPEFHVMQDLSYFTLRLHVLKSAISNLSKMDVIELSEGYTLAGLN